MANRSGAASPSAITRHRRVARSRNGRLDDVGVGDASLADAESLEDVAEQILGAAASGDLLQAILRLLDVGQQELFGKRAAGARRARARPRRRASRACSSSVHVTHVGHERHVAPRRRLRQVAAIRAASAASPSPRSHGYLDDGRTRTPPPGSFHAAGKSILFTTISRGRAAVDVEHARDRRRARAASDRARPAPDPHRQRSLGAPHAFLLDHVLASGGGPPCPRAPARARGCPRAR